VSLPYRTSVKVLFAAAIFQSIGCSDDGGASAAGGAPTSVQTTPDAGDSPPTYASPTMDAGSAAIVADAGVSPIQIGSSGGGSVVSVDVTPLALTPAFSPSINDYYVTC